MCALMELMGGVERKRREKIDRGHRKRRGERRNINDSRKWDWRPGESRLSMGRYEGAAFEINKSHTQKSKQCIIMQVLHKARGGATSI
jgi:hypothetical protein